MNTMNIVYKYYLHELHDNELSKYEPKGNVIWKNIGHGLKLAYEYKVGKQKGFAH